MQCAFAEASRRAQACASVARGTVCTRELGNEAGRFEASVAIARHLRLAAWRRLGANQANPLAPGATENSQGRGRLATMRGKTLARASRTPRSCNTGSTGCDPSSRPMLRPEAAQWGIISGGGSRVVVEQAMLVNRASTLQSMYVDVAQPALQVNRRSIMRVAQELPRVRSGARPEFRSETDTWVSDFLENRCHANRVPREYRRRWYQVPTESEP